GPLARDGFIPISEIEANPLRLDNKMKKMYDEETAEVQEIPVQVPVWVDPVARGGTPMCAVLSDAYYKLEGWIADHPDCFPPIVVHITDGEAQDGDPIEFAEPLRSLATTNGEVLLFNCSLSMLAADKILFPSSLESVPEKLAMDLFKMSSPLPEPIFQQASKEFTLSPGARAFVFNADAVALVQFLEMGTKAPPNLR
ncbi:MAG: VWA domain-containing protein, partial [Planctomycetota bacterium]|nr:VWA domain-containing protein [Planctomycetota bacterium]